LTNFLRTFPSLVISLKFGVSNKQFLNNLAFPIIILSTAKAEKYYSISIWFQYFKSIFKHFSYQPDLDDIGYILKLSYQPGLDEIGYIFKLSYQPDPGIGYLFFIEKIIIHTRLVVLVLKPDDHSVFLLLVNFCQN
jgi:hypothetical protein